MKKSVIGKKLTALSLIVASLSLTACSEAVTDERFKGLSKNEIIEYYNQLEQEYTNLETTYSQIQTTVEALQSDDSLTSAVSSVGDGTGKLTFNSMDSKIIFPSSFQYPGAETAAPSSKVDIVNNVSISPSSTWIFKLNGSTLELEHSSGISGIIKVGHIYEGYESELLKTDVISPWFSSLPASQVKYKDIFIDGSKFGCQAETPTMINSEDAYLKCGMAAYGEYSITFVFVYRGVQDSTKDESISSILNSITINSGELSINN